MKKGIVIVAAVLFAITTIGCKAKYGCPGSPRRGELTEDQKIAAGKKVKQSKYKGGTKGF